MTNTGRGKPSVHEAFHPIPNESDDGDVESDDGDVGSKAF